MLVNLHVIITTKSSYYYVDTNLKFSIGSKNKHLFGFTYKITSFLDCAM